MIKQQFDLVSELHERIHAFRMLNDKEPTSVTLSPAAFEWLLAIFEEDRRILGVSPVDYDNWTYSTDSATMQIIIDETIENFELSLS